jgi:hypothetical protein
MIYALTEPLVEKVPYQALFDWYEAEAAKATALLP